MNRKILVISNGATAYEAKDTWSCLLFSLGQKREKVVDIVSKVLLYGE